ncbi:hypothetical protein B2K_10840 [Paenibacillus mucilaginosus K02]|uniref:Uncharacterized protein n=1 Tax=Paenibacillus mucilaginosus K02 TaxID=997761 RepID=I0BFR4_9BACL|nr:hypothetical protein B2K_10840 [Paenibacillus mucilaginosus K02]
MGSGKVGAKFSSQKRIVLLFQQLTVSNDGFGILLAGQPVLGIMAFIEAIGLIDIQKISFMGI